MLQYIGTRSLDGRATELKEYIIGVEALDRPSDFDPKVDTIVRVQIHRLREKLQRYYELEGCQDGLELCIPRGSYCVQFKHRPQQKAAELQRTVTPNLPIGPIASASSTIEQPAPRRWSAFVLPLAAVFAAAVCSFFLGRRSINNEAPAAPHRDGAVATLWLSFLDGDKDPIIGYPDAVFLLDESNDLLRYRSGALNERGSEVEHHLAEEFASNPDLARHAGKLYYEDGYTGTGELESAAMLAALFHDLGVHPHLKRSRDITIEDLRTHNTVLLGSSFQNKAVRELPLQGDFQFVAASLRHEIWGGSILNRSPQEGEDLSFHTERDSATQALRVDHALVSFQPGFVSGKHIVILGGLDTAGTACATQFVTSAEGAAKVLKGRQSPANSQPSVQTVLRCTLNDGHSVSSIRSVVQHSQEWHEQ